MTRQVSTSPDVPPPAGPYSQLVRAGDLVFLSGQGPARPDGSMPEGAAEQTRQCLTNLLTVLATVGATEADVIRVGVFLTEQADFPAMNQVYGEVFGEPYPARTTVYVGLPAKMRVEIDVVAQVRSA